MSDPRLPAPRRAPPMPTVSNNNSNFNMHSGVGDIINKNPIKITNFIHPEAIKPGAKIAAALKQWHVPEAAFDAQKSKCMDGTRVQILHDIDIWIKDPEAPSIFWLTGGAGTGKTAITTSVCERAHDDGSIILGGSFFCSRSSGLISQRDVRNIIPTLAQHLARQSMVYAQALSDELEADPDVLRKRFDVQIRRLLYNPLLSLEGSHKTVVYVIDALDECGGQLDGNGTADDIDSHRIVSEMLAALVDFTNSGVNLLVKFFVTSRPETHIRDTPVSNATFSKVLKLHDVNKEQVKTDIRQYVSVELGCTVELRERFKAADIDRLVHISDGLFIVATTALKHTLHGPEGLDGAAERFQTLLNAAQDGLSPDAAAPLDLMYGAILTDSGGVDTLQSEKLLQLQRLLATLLSARMTLSIAALAALLHLSKTSVRRDLSRLHAVVHVSGDDEASLRTLHASFGDYLFERAPDHIKIARSLGHRLLTQGCFRTMETGLHFNVSQSRSSYDQNPQMRHDNITLALEYACLQWIYHASIVPEGSENDQYSSPLMSWTRRIFLPFSSSQLDESIKITFRPQFLFWLEVKSVLGLVPRAAAMLMLAAVTVRSKELSRFFRDAIFFIASSQEAIERSAPHIYLSALPFASKDSLIYKTFAPLCTGLISVELFGIAHHGGRLVMTLNGHDSAVNSVSYSPDGLLVASGSTDGTVRIWDMSTGAEAMAPLRGGDGSVWSVAFSPDGGSVASGSDAGIVHMWRLLDGHATPQRLTGHTGAIASVAWSSDGSFIASASKDTTVRLWSTDTGMLRAEMRLHEEAVNAVAISPDSRTVVSGSDDRTIGLWSPATGDPVGRPINNDLGAIICICFSSDGKTIAGCSQWGHIRLWKVRTGEKIAALQDQPGKTRSVQTSANGRYLVSVDDKHVRLWTLPRYMAKASSIVLDGHTGIVRAATFSADDLYVASGSDDGTVRIWNAGDERLAVQPSRGHSKHVNSVGISPDGTLIVSGSDKTIRVWKAHTGEAKLPPLEGHSDSVRRVVVSPNGRSIASASADCTVRIWNLRTGRMIGRPLKKHTDPVRAVAFSADGRWLASGSDDMSVYIWDVAARNTTIGPLCCRGSVEEHQQQALWLRWHLSAPETGPYLSRIPLLWSGRSVGAAGANPGGTALSELSK